MIEKFYITPTEEFTNITTIVQNHVTEKNIKNGLCLIYTKHTTACVDLIEPETLLKEDMHDFLERLAPSTVKYRHDDIENRDVPPDERLNGFSHLRAMLLNHQVFVPIVEGELDLGTWQAIYYIECDLGKTNRTFNILIKE